jgi:NAD/NADP transhydrogenase beta subunit
MIDLILYILALICFIIATFGLAASGRAARINFIAAGLAFWVLTLVLSGLTIGTR